uniref:CRAL-TRIO domain-containing protein n=1 Tax=Kalanchoe fedtschenkoi TaxID=63787 RepID=A0A7N0T844_KALFE
MFRKKHTQNHPEAVHADEDAKMTELRAAIGPLSGRSFTYCTDACLRRYLVARNWNVEKAKKMLEDTLQWRASYKPEEITWPEVAFEGETGKVSIANFHDRLGRTVVIMRPGLQNSTSTEGNIRHLFYLIEKAVLNLAEGQEQMVWLIDFTGLSYKNNVPIKTTREIVHILQNHYPETLGLAFLYNPPMIFHTFWKVVKYFLDPITFQKVNFIYSKNKDSVELMGSFFDTENLPSEFGGKASLKYDHEEFSKLMTQYDIKTASYWGLDQKPHTVTNGLEKLEEVPEHLHLAPPAT